MYLPQVTDLDVYLMKASMILMQVFLVAQEERRNWGWRRVVWTKHSSGGRRQLGIRVITRDATGSGMARVIPLSITPPITPRVGNSAGGYLGYVISALYDRYAIHVVSRLGFGNLVFFYWLTTSSNQIYSYGSNNPGAGQSMLSDISTNRTVDFF